MHTTVKFLLIAQNHKQYLQNSYNHWESGHVQNHTNKDDDVYSQNKTIHIYEHLKLFLGFIVLVLSLHRLQLTVYRILDICWLKSLLIKVSEELFLNSVWEDFAKCLACGGCKLLNSANTFKILKHLYSHL